MTVVTVVGWLLLCSGRHSTTPVSGVACANVASDMHYGTAQIIYGPCIRLSPISGMMRWVCVKESKGRPAVQLIRETLASPSGVWSYYKALPACIILCVKPAIQVFGWAAVHLALQTHLCLSGSS